MALPRSIALPLRLTATALDVAAGALRTLAGEPDERAPAPVEPLPESPPTRRAPVPEPAVAPAAAERPKPPRATRSRIANPKAARKVRERKATSS
jgi:hypothetical protein